MWFGQHSSRRLGAGAYLRLAPRLGRRLLLNLFSLANPSRARVRLPAYFVLKHVSDT